MTLFLTPGDGCGNRFLLAQAQELVADAMVAAELALRVGAAGYDGLLLVHPEEGGALPVEILNADGSDGGVCLNGLRVVAAASGKERGCLRMAGRRIAWRRAGEEIELTLPLRTSDLVVTEHRDDLGTPWFQVDFWNPHAVFSSLPQGVDLSDFAASVRERRELFPQGVNVEIVPELGSSDELSLRVDERGVGETQACGSGALAVAAVAWRLGAGSRLGLRMAGGRLELQRLGEGVVGLRGAAGVGRRQALEALLVDDRKPSQ